MGSEVSTQGDVYSFGILLLEMFTRKRPSDGMFYDSLNLHKFVEMSLPEPERVMQIVDQVLGKVKQPQIEAAEFNGASDEKLDYPGNVAIETNIGMEQGKLNGVTPESQEVENGKVEQGR
ncbi:hypothetical protein F0562_027397 [Nyssa sinensis]|uniref:Serine-threonine/tyrosine-protein kinase catalytic domain-containing protein n=1 Tax=Nyssa sinensis TaxID=561372 RepID=A0A5J5B4B1_9ASTE|nr:hypothetical protein F0562_027397 [Nyssa sinensis]